MKIRSFVFTTLLLLCSAGAAHAQFTQARLQVAGLNCALCAKTTERELRALPFIADVKPDLMHNIYVITFKPGQLVNFTQIGQIIRNENFFISFLKATVNFDQVKLNGGAFIEGQDTYKLLNPARKPLSGKLEFTMVDKGFAPRSISKKYLSNLVDDPTQTGRIYHLVI